MGKPSTAMTGQAVGSLSVYRTCTAPCFSKQFKFTLSLNMHARGCYHPCHHTGHESSDCSGHYSNRELMRSFRTTMDYHRNYFNWNIMWMCDEI